MENKKLIIALSVLIIFLVVILFSVFFYFSIKNAPQRTDVTVSDTGPNNEKPAHLLNGEEKIPSIITGKISSVSENKVIISQFASVDLEYEIERKDIKKIIFLVKNSKFNEIKARQVQEELSKIEAPKESSGTKMDQDKTKEAVEAFKGRMAKLAEDPELQMFVEELGEWDQLKRDQQINFIKQADGTGVLTIYPDTFSIGPESQF